MLLQGSVVRRKSNKEVLGTVAGPFHSILRPGLYTVIVADQERGFPYWFWDDHLYWLDTIIERTNLLHELCKGKWVYNFDENDIELYQTKLGNII